MYNLLQTNTYTCDPTGNCLTCRITSTNCVTCDPNSVYNI